MSIQFWKIPASGGAPDGFEGKWVLNEEKQISARDYGSAFWPILQFPLSTAADKWLVRTGENQYTIADDELLKLLRLEEHFSTFPYKAKRKKLVEVCMEVPYSDFSANDDNIFFALRWYNFGALSSLNDSAKEALRDKKWPEALRRIPAEFWGEMTPFEKKYRERVSKAREQGFDVLADYIDKRFPELELHAPNDENGIQGLRWRATLERESFWVYIQSERFNKADAILRSTRPDLYGTPEPKCDIAEQLNHFFKTTPREEILRIWESTNEFDGVGLPMEPNRDIRDTEIEVLKMQIASLQREVKMWMEIADGWKKAAK